MKALTIIFISIAILCSIECTRSISTNLKTTQNTLPQLEGKDFISGANCSKNQNCKSLWCHTRKRWY